MVGTLLVKTEPPHNLGVEREDGTSALSGLQIFPGSRNQFRAISTEIARLGKVLTHKPLKLSKCAAAGPQSVR